MAKQVIFWLTNNRTLPRKDRESHILHHKGKRTDFKLDCFPPNLCSIHSLTLTRELWGLYAVRWTHLLTGTYFFFSHSELIWTSYMLPKKWPHLYFPSALYHSILLLLGDLPASWPPPPASIFSFQSHSCLSQFLNQDSKSRRPSFSHWARLVHSLVHLLPDIFPAISMDSRLL